MRQWRIMYCNILQQRVLPCISQLGGTWRMWETLHTQESVYKIIKLRTLPRGDFGSCIFGVATSSLCHECWPKKTMSHCDPQLAPIVMVSPTSAESLGCRRKPLSLQGCRSMPIMPMAGTEHLCAWSKWNISAFVQANPRLWRLRRQPNW